MSEDRSLDDFVDAAGNDDTAGYDDAASNDDTADTDEDGDPVADASVGEGEDAEPDTDADTEFDAPTTEAMSAESTSTWASDGDDCDRCGRRVERRWRENDAFVCGDCKEW